MGINKRTLVLSSSHLINLLSETVVLVEQNYNEQKYYKKEIKKRANRKPCEILSYIQGKTGFRVADAGDIQQYLIDRGFKIKKDFDFGNETAIAVGKHLKYLSATKLFINSRADLVNYLYKEYPTEFGTPENPETFGLGPRAQGVIADLLYDKCLREEDALQKQMKKEFDSIPQVVLVVAKLQGINVNSPAYKGGYGMHYALNKDAIDKHAAWYILQDENVDFGGDCIHKFGGILPGAIGPPGSPERDLKGVQLLASSYLRTIIENMKSKSGWGASSTGPCSGKYGLFGRAGSKRWSGDVSEPHILTLQDALITGEYCISKYGAHDVKNYVNKEYNGNWVKALYTETGTLDMCELGELIDRKVDYEWDRAPAMTALKGLVNACKNDPWTCLEYTADAISFIAVWFGPYGWGVSAIFGFISIFAMIKNEKYGWAIIAGAFECFGILMLIKHIKTVKVLAGYGDDTIEAGIKYFDNPTDEAYKALSFEAKQVVMEMRASRHTIKAIMKTVDNNEIKHVIQAVRTEMEFVNLVKLGTVSGLDDIGWKQFKGLQKSIRNSDRALDKVYNGIKTVTKFSIVLGSGFLASKWAANKVNNAIFKKIINNTSDIITENQTRIGGAYKMKRDATNTYSVKHILARSGPYMTTGARKDWGSPGIGGSNTNYTDALKAGDESSTGLIMLTKIWRDKTNFPEIIPTKGSCVYSSPNTEIILDRVVNPGGGWRPNLACLNKYDIRKDEGALDTTETIRILEETINEVLEGKIEEAEARRKIGIDLNMPAIEYNEIVFEDIGDYEIL